MVGQPEPPVGVHTLTIHLHLTRIAVLKPATEQALLSAETKAILMYGITIQQLAQAIAIIQPTAQPHTQLMRQPLVTAITTGQAARQIQHTSTIAHQHIRRQQGIVNLPQELPHAIR